MPRKEAENKKEIFEGKQNSTLNVEFTERMFKV